MLTPSHPLQLVLGLVVWSLWFVFWYGSVSLACGLAPPDQSSGAGTWINLGLLLISLPVVAVLLFWSWRGWRARERDLPQRLIVWVSSAVHLFAAGAILFMSLPVLVLPPCV